MRFLAVLFALSLLAAPLAVRACEDEVHSEAKTGAAEADAPAVPLVAAEGAQAPAAEETAPEEQPSCGHAEFIGQNIKDIDTDALGVPVRVLYPDSPATMDYNPARINIILEPGTDKVTEVRCG